MPNFITPNDDTELREYNDCHSPKGPRGGQFCASDASGKVSLGAYPYEQDSRKIPGYLKGDVLAARRAGIAVFHYQQPEPVMDTTGEIHDPLAKSHANSRTYDWYARKGGMMLAPGGRVFLSTRGGEFDPYYETWGNYGPTGKKLKDLTPEMLTNPASEDDIASTFRHEVGHLQDQLHTPSTIGVTLGREIRAWQYAIEASPDHRASERMMRNGLMSHAYYQFRSRQLESDPLYGRTPRYDREEVYARVISNENKDRKYNAEAKQQAAAFTDRVVKSLNRYGALLRKRGIGVRVPQARPPWWPTPKVTAGPGGRGQL